MSASQSDRRVQRIVSGGQTGADRGGLDAAIQLGIPHGGWCPLDRLAEDGNIPARYQLDETESAEYPVRTECNVVDSDATLILFRQRVHGGTQLTERLAVKHAKPHLLVDLSSPQSLPEIREWLIENNVRILNIAGPRDSSSPGIGEEVRNFLIQLLG